MLEWLIEVTLASIVGTVCINILIKIVRYEKVHRSIIEYTDSSGSTELDEARNKKPTMF